MVAQLLLQALKTLSLVLFYYSFSISLTFYNKWILMVSRAPLGYADMQVAKKLPQLVRTERVQYVLLRLFLEHCLQFPTYLKSTFPSVCKIPSAFVYPKVIGSN